MDSSSVRRNAPRECHTTSPAISKQLASTSQRTLSFSSSSSSISSSSSPYFPDDSPPSPATPLRHFYGVPFSWEHLPGIPKKPSHKKKDTAFHMVLPLPPPALTPPASKRFNFEEFGIRSKKNCNHDREQRLEKDPFFAAFVECSKDGEDGDELCGGGKVTRSISDRFGFINLYASSCKRGCSVSESIVYLPRSSRTTSYDLISHRPRYRRQ